VQGIRRAAASRSERGYDAPDGWVCPACGGEGIWWDTGYWQRFKNRRGVTLPCLQGDGGRHRRL